MGDRRKVSLKRRLAKGDAFSAMPFVCLGDADWQRRNIADVATWAERNRHWGVAVIAARSRPWAAQWLRQAPCLLLAIEAAGGSVDQAVFAKYLFESFRRPRDMLAEAKIAPQFASMPIEGLGYTPAVLLRWISHELKPSEIAQIIPTQAGAQVEWLNLCESFRRQIERRSSARQSRRRQLVAWAAKAMASWDGDAGGHVDEVADYVATHAQGFNTGWNWGQAIKASQDWHAELSRQSADQRQASRLGVTLDTEIDYGPLPVMRAVGSLEFVALQTGRSMHAEGAAMHHCVATYFPDVVRGKSRIFSLRRDGRRIATLELAKGRDGWRAVQLKGRCNAQPPDDIREAATAFVAQCNEKSG